ncbi:hypothetical protein BDZ85DRAFT_264828 [Elsinoe ampelina]|uniref:Uncharacterized protein n=1 Tax=Elsinoe ampelina TaxID=302913 RepID=A0A6A6G9L2_9PEZI|nr:hypothetical protein BDZ85DRAFT_264828 [Elsinoe ampelina]
MLLPRLPRGQETGKLQVITDGPHADNDIRPESRPICGPAYIDSIVLQSRVGLCADLCTDPGRPIPCNTGLAPTALSKLSASSPQATQDFCALYATQSASVGTRRPKLLQTSSCTLKSHQRRPAGTSQSLELLRDATQASPRTALTYPSASPSAPCNSNGVLIRHALLTTPSPARYMIPISPSPVNARFTHHKTVDVAPQPQDVHLR